MLDQHFPTHDIDSAPERSKPALRGAQKQFGSIPNLMGRIASSPSLMKAFLNGSATLAEGSLTELEREAIVLAIAIENECHYCIALHSVQLKAHGHAELVSTLQGKRTPDDARLGLLVDLAREIVRTRSQISSSMRERMHALSPETILDVVLAVGLQTMTNYTSHVAGHELDPFLAHQ
jgi:AhpD family alkylhydroperoxidase